MKKIIILSAAVLLVVFLLSNNSPVVDTTNDLLLENVQALAYGGGGNGEINPPVDPEDPNKKYSECWRSFTKTDAGKLSRLCVEFNQKAAYVECLEFYSGYVPVEETKKVCKFSSSGQEN